MKPSSALPDTSASPPLPPPAPRALIRPAKSVRRSDHSTTRPPSPVPVASARIAVPASAVVVVARASLPPPCQSPPTRIDPPPLAPEASSVAPASATSAPVSVIVPPRAVKLEASSTPDTLTTPRAASRAVPAVSTICRALIRPATLIPPAGTATCRKPSPARSSAGPAPSVRRSTISGPPCSSASTPA